MRLTEHEQKLIARLQKQEKQKRLAYTILSSGIIFGAMYMLTSIQSHRELSAVNAFYITLTAGFAIWFLHQKLELFQLIKRLLAENEVPGTKGTGNA